MNTDGGKLEQLFKAFDQRAAQAGQPAMSLSIGKVVINNHNAVVVRKRKRRNHATAAALSAVAFYLSVAPHLVDLSVPAALS